MAREVDTWVHRIGRTGRAGRRGKSITLLHRQEERIAIDLVEVLEKCDLPVEKWLSNMAKRGKFLRDQKARLGKK